MPLDRGSEVVERVDSRGRDRPAGDRGRDLEQQEGSDLCILTNEEAEDDCQCMIPTNDWSSVAIYGT